MRYYTHNSVGTWECDADGNLLESGETHPYCCRFVAAHVPVRPIRQQYVGFGLENLPANPSDAALSQLAPVPEDIYQARLSRYRAERARFDLEWTRID